MVKIPKELKTFLIVLFFLSLVGISLLILFGNAQTKAPDTLKYFYLNAFLGFTGLAIMGFGRFLYRKFKANDKYGDSIGFNGIGERPSLKWFKNWTHTRLFLASLILFGWTFFILNFIRGATKLTALRTLQQFSVLDSLTFTTLMTPASENIFILAMSFLVYMLFTYVAVRFKLAKAEYSIYAYAIYALVGAGFAWILHQTVYAGSDFQLGVVLIFWAVGGIITLATGSPMPFLALHIVNNVSIDLRNIVQSSDVFSLYYGIALAILTVIYFLFYRDDLLGRKPNG